MFDKIIYKKLTDQGFEDSLIKEFINSFAEHRKLYREFNEDMVDLLFALTNFENFCGAMKNVWKYTQLRLIRAYNNTLYILFKIKFDTVNWGHL